MAASSNAQTYNDLVVRQFSVMTVVWGIVGMLVGCLIAAQLYWPALNFDIAWLTYGRLRPLHTNAVIFAFGGCALFGTSLYVVQRTCHVRLISDKLAAFVFWGWQAVIVLAAITLPMGLTEGKEYAELIWPIDVLIAVVWVAYGVLFFGTIARRKVRHIYVANWFYGSFIIAVALLHIVNSLAIPTSLTHSYPIYSRRRRCDGAVVVRTQRRRLLPDRRLPGNDVLLRAAPGRAADLFLPAVDRALLGADRHLHVGRPASPAIHRDPDWAQSLGMVFSLILLAPSWGGAINGVMTLSGAWYKLRTDPILKFLIVAISFYMMSTFEGPMMSIKTVNALSHYTDWTIGHVHSGALGWVAMISIGAVYMMIPRCLGLKQMASTRLIDVHFWVHTIGVVLYVVAMWVSGIGQGLMSRAAKRGWHLDLRFIEIVKFTYPYYFVRLCGGLLCLSGMVIMAVNVARTYQLARGPIAIPVLPVPADNAIDIATA
jgi:cytochrome c oxidase cbb3-type subunit 1